MVNTGAALGALTGRGGCDALFPFAVLHCPAALGKEGILINLSDLFRMVMLAGAIMLM